MCRHAINNGYKVRWYQHVHSSVYSNPAKGDKKTDIIEEEQYSVKAVQERAAADSDLKYLRGETASTVEKSLIELVKYLAK